MENSMGSPVKNQMPIWLKVIGVIVLMVIVAFVTVKLVVKPQGQTTSAYDKILASGTIRACYSAYPPYFIKDPNSGAFSGIFFDVVNKMAKNLSLKVDWNAEVTRGEAIAAVNSGKCDIIGSGFWGNSARGRAAELSTPVYYNPVDLYVRADDTRFDGDYTVANDAKYTFATVDGQSSQAIAQTQFPNAKTLALPDSTSAAQLMLSVADGKADMTSSDTATALLFMKNNPGKIKDVSKALPVVIYGNSVLMKKGEFALTSAINAAITELINNGYVDSVIKNYEIMYPGDYYPVARPYTIPTK
ncbi:MAG: transporter substrate-binding domain-containing protein [Candidatus Staskawiczbacteria bacterium]|nr:transporter substrate-binding domain-containing protein [Candidatus Staskawiczbacteria bacterium]